MDMDRELEQDLFQLCNIRLIGRFSDSLSELEDDYLDDGKYQKRFVHLGDHG